MAFVPFLNCVELVATYQNILNLNVAKNVWGFQFAGGIPDVDAMEDLRDAYVTWENAVTGGKSQRSNQIQLVNIYIRGLTTQFEPVIDYTLPGPILGTVVSPVMPMSVTLAVKLTTGFAGRSRRGRHYWIGLAETQVTGDFVNTTTANAIRLQIETFRTTYSLTAGFSQVILSRVENGVPRVTGLATLVTGTALEDTRVDTQRRRLIGEGE